MCGANKCLRCRFWIYRGGTQYEWTKVKTLSMLWTHNNTPLISPLFTNTSVLWVSYQIRKIAGCAWAGNAGNVFPATDFKRKLLASDPGMHHGTCVTHAPWCMSGSLTHGDGENVPGISGVCATHNFTYLIRGPWSDRSLAATVVSESLANWHALYRRPQSCMTLSKLDLLPHLQALHVRYE